MDIHTATEMAYKNGYFRGAKEVREETTWVELNGEIVCEKCKSKVKDKTKFCPNCGRVVFYYV